jgi:hypothetical protein
MEFVLKFGIRFNSKFSDKRDFEVIVAGKVGNVKRRVTDFSKGYGLQGLKSFYVCFADPHSSIP